MSVLSVTESNFNIEVSSSDLPVLIDFWAPWCGPCRTMSPIIDAVAAENAGRAKVVKVNVDEEPELARQFGVMSIPTLVLVKDGKTVSTLIGARPKHDVERMIK